MFLLSARSFCSLVPFVAVLHKTKTVIVIILGTHHPLRTAGKSVVRSRPDLRKAFWDLRHDRLPLDGRSTSAMRTGRGQLRRPGPLDPLPWDLVQGLSLDVAHPGSSGVRPEFHSGLLHRQLSFRQGRSADHQHLPRFLTRSQRTKKIKFSQIKKKSSRRKKLYFRLTFGVSCFD